MRVGVFSKFECSGGSEFRCVEMVNALNRLQNCEGVLLAEKRIPARVRDALDTGAACYEGVFTQPRVELLYDFDTLLIVNTDSKDFTKLDYWQGKSGRHHHQVDLKQVRQMVFLFNFIVSPSRQLITLQPFVDDIRIITANMKFFREISEQDRYEAVRHYPRLYLESPIDPDSVTPEKTRSSKLRFGMHSKPVGNKWNPEFGQLVRSVNEQHQQHVCWKFMGMPDAIAGTLCEFENVSVRPEFSQPVREFLRQVDVFVFFPTWGREEPWSRATAEALASGCPVITTTKGGNRDQVVHGNNGFLCKSTTEFVNYCQELVNDRERLAALRRNAIHAARQFSSQAVARKFLEFVR